MIKNLVPQLAERGKIKIGGLGEERKKKGKEETYRLPEKYDHFVITTMQRDSAGRMIPDKALMDQVKEKTGTTGKLTEIPIRLLYDDIELNFQSRLSCYVGNRCWCSGDGEFAQRLGQGQVDDKQAPGKSRAAKPDEYGTLRCPCERLEATFSADKGRCKPMGTLQVLLEGIDRVGGVWKLRTTSWNTVKAILSSLSLIKTITGGPLARIPLCLVISPKTVTVPGTGQSQVVFVVSLEYRGSEEQLAEVGYGIAKRRMEHQVRMDSIELQAQKLLVAPHEEQPIEQEETAKEFFHEAADATIDQPPGHEPPPDQRGVEGEGEATRAGSRSPGQYHQPAPITFPELMDLCHKGTIGEMMRLGPVHIRSHKPGADILAELMTITKAPDSKKTSLTINLAPNFAKLTDLTPEMIQKSFSEAGINLTINHPAPKEPEPPPTNSTTTEPEPQEEAQEILLETNVLPSLAFKTLKDQGVPARIEPDGRIFYPAEHEALVKEIFPGNGNHVEPPAPSEEEIVACHHCGYEFPGGDICPNCEMSQDGGPPSKADTEEKRGERPRLF